MPVDPWPDPLAIARLIAGAEAVVARSFHLTIVALANGVPVLRGPADEGSKYAPLESLPGVHTIRPDTDIAAWLTAMARGPVAAEIVGAASQVEVHWDRLAALVENGADTGGGPAESGRQGPRGHPRGRRHRTSGRIGELSGGAVGRRQARRGDAVRG